jgi:hypothetical protein
MNCINYRFALVICAIALLGPAYGMEREEYAVRFQEAENQPIECWQKLIDQDGRPLSDVAVSVTIWSEKPGKEMLQEKSVKGIRTNNEGVIHIEGEKGGYLRVAVSDDRYVHGDSRPGAFPGSVFKYSKNSGAGSIDYGTANAPGVITIWRKEGNQALIALTGEIFVPYDGKAIHVDLVNGMLVNIESDLNIEVQMPETEEARLKAADHRGIIPAKITVKVNGGLLNIKKDTNRYKTAVGIWEREFPVTTLTGQIVNFEGFLKLRDGALMGRMRLTVGLEDIGHGGQGRLGIRIDDSLINAAGSRSLEQDPTTLRKIKLQDGRAESGGPTHTP